MLGKQSLSAVGTALGFSLIALVANVMLQGALLFRSSLARLSQPRLSSVRSLLRVNDSQAAVLFSVVPTLANERIQEFIGIYDFSTCRPKMRALGLDIDPWAISSSTRRGLLFISACDGRLYSLDLRQPANGLLQLGRHEPSPVHLFECAEDGSLVVVASLKQMSAWDTQSRRLLWQRTDLAATAGAFVPGSQRFLCGLECGSILELDPQSGETLRTLGGCDHWINGITVSPCQTYVACMDALGKLSLIDIHSGCQLWSRRCARLLGGKPATPVVCPRFLPGQAAIAVAYAVRGKQLLVHSIATGEIIGGLSETGGDIKGLEVADSGVVYAWDDAGSVIAWDSAAGRVCQRFSPERDLARCTAASHLIRRLDLRAELQ